MPKTRQKLDLKNRESDSYFEFEAAAMTYKKWKPFKYAEFCLEKIVNLYQAKLFSAGFSNLEPLWAAVS
jgi:hypothetical protein